MNFFAWRFGKQGATACDESLAEHDKKYHPDGFDPERETCNKRAEMAKADKGDVLSPSDGAENCGDKPLVSAAEDAAYMDAVKRGDMETAAKMVREVAGRAMPKILKDNNGIPMVVFHGTNSKKKGKFPFTVFNTLKVGKLTKDADTPVGSYFTSNINYANGVAIYQSRLNHLNHGRKPVVGKFFLNNPMQYLTSEMEYVAIKPSQIKSADPVTYDDDGNVIPLSRRFDGGDDIRGDVKGK